LALENLCLSGHDRIMTVNVARPADYTVDEQDWGRLVWMVSGALGNSTVLTVGRCFIKPGQANPAHYHPNSDEVLHVVRGHIEHRVDDASVEMKAGDTISIPLGAIHQARNIGPDEAEFLITFNTADRQVVGE
jgi:quercetin dioxygenase-like cupin family protein